MLFGDVDQHRFWKRGDEMDATCQCDHAKAIPQVLYHWEVAGEGMTGGSDGDVAGKAAATNYDSQIAQSFPLSLTAKMGGRPTGPNAADGIDDASEVMSPQILEQLAR